MILLKKIFNCENADSLLQLCWRLFNCEKAGRVLQKMVQMQTDLYSSPEKALWVKKQAYLCAQP